MLPEATMTFDQLGVWYLGLKSVKKLATYDRIRGCISNFNKVFGSQIVGEIKPIDLEDYQDSREEQGLAPASIDMELSIVKTMITKAFDNDMVGGRSLKPFRKIKRKLKKGSNARDRTLSLQEYLALTTGTHTVKYKIRSKTKETVKPNAPAHLKPILIVAYHTGMRHGELLGLQWSHIDHKGFIRLPASMVKEDKPKSIPLNKYAREALESLPRHLHHDYVFTYQGQPIKKLGRSFQSACKNAGVPYGRKTENGVTLHDFRASFDTNMDRAGVSESCRKVILGHTLAGMDRHYLRLSEDDLTEAIVRYTTYFDDQLQNVLKTLSKSEKSLTHES
jgi:integrase